MDDLAVPGCKAGRAAIVAEGNGIDEGRGLHAGDRTKALLERSHEGGLLLIFFVDGFRQREIGTCDTTDLEAGLNRLQGLETAE